jgi:hypothetical protein
MDKSIAFFKDNLYGQLRAWVREQTRNQSHFDVVEDIAPDIRFAASAFRGTWLEDASDALLDELAKVLKEIEE